MGEPAGISCEISLKAYSHFLEHHKDGDPGFFLIDDPARVEKVVRELNADISVATISDPAHASAAFTDGLPVFPISAQVVDVLKDVKTGNPQSRTAEAVICSIEQAANLALNKKVAGVVTNPIQKQALIASGFTFMGHTEFLGELTASVPLPAGVIRGPVMLLAGSELRAAPVTIHIPISEVPATLTSDLIVRTSAIVAQSLKRDFGVDAPVLAICGLNPHAGEGGEIGLEDRDIIAPAIADLNRQGVQAIGPIPADSMFHPEARSRYHAAIAMYHDQALIPIKTISFHSAVNVTLGLPIIRTSPDHGTGLNIAGKGVARPDSLIQAISLVHVMSRQRRRFDNSLNTQRS